MKKIIQTLFMILIHMQSSYALCDPEFTTISLSSTDTQAHLSWSIEPQSCVAGFQIRYTDGYPGWLILKNINVDSNTTYSFNHTLPKGKIHQYKIVIITKTGNEHYSERLRWKAPFQDSSEFVLISETLSPEEVKIVKRHIILSFSGIPIRISSAPNEDEMLLESLPSDQYIWIRIYSDGTTERELILKN